MCCVVLRKQTSEYLFEGSASLAETSVLVPPASFELLTDVLFSELTASHVVFRSGAACVHCTVPVSLPRFAADEFKGAQVSDVAKVVQFADDASGCSRGFLAELVDSESQVASEASCNEVVAALDGGWRCR